MRFFDQKLSLLILIVSLPLLFLPKINLLSLDSSETAGLRIDDIILFVLCCFLMGLHLLSHRHISQIERGILSITAFSLFSFLCSVLLSSFGYLPMASKIFYVFRLFEYFMFFYIGMIAARHLKGTSIIWAFFGFNLVLMILQKLNFAGAIISTGYLADVTGRVQGIASFPSEMGLLLNLLFCYLMYDNSGPSQFLLFFPSPYVRHALRLLYPYAMFCIFAIFVIFTGNRISILALIICFFFRVKQDFNFRTASSWLSLAVLLPLVLAAAALIVVKTAAVYERSLDLLSWKNLELFTIVWDKIDISQMPIGNEGLASEQYDLSWLIRIQKWLFITKTYVLHPECYLQGLGPGYCGAALDGGFLRIATEYGVIGVFLFWKFFASLCQLNRQTKWMMIAFAFNMIFFDAYLAYKTMSLLLFACGSIYAQQHNEESLFVPVPDISTQRH